MTVYVEIFLKEKTRRVLNKFKLLIDINFKYLEKNGALKFFNGLAGPGNNDVHGLPNPPTPLDYIMLEWSPYYPQAQKISIYKNK